MTITRTEVERVAKALRDEMVLSVAIDSGVNDPAQLHAWQRAAIDTIESAGAERADAPKSEREALARASELVRLALPSTPADVGGGAWIALATPTRVALAGAVPGRIASRADWARGPHVGHALGALTGPNSTLAALVDSVSASVYRCTADRIDRLVRLHAHVGDSQPTHMGGQPRQGFHPGTRGRTAAEAATHARREGHRRMLAEAVDRAERLAGREGVIVVGGEQSSARELASMLEARCPQRVVRADYLRIGASESEIGAMAMEAACEVERARQQTAVRRVLERAGAGGRGAAGWDAVSRALDQGAVRELLVTTTALEAPVAGVDPERLVALALAEGAAVSVLEGATAAALDRQSGGVAAELRFAFNGMAGAANGEERGALAE